MKDIDRYGNRMFTALQLAEAEARGFAAGRAKGVEESNINAPQLIKVSRDRTRWGAGFATAHIPNLETAVSTQALRAATSDTPRASPPPPEA